MTIRADIVDGNDGRKGRHGWELSRIAIVHGISPLLNRWDKLAAAVAEIELTDPIGAAHPSEFLWRNGGPVVFLESFEPISLATDIVKVRIIYREFPFFESVYQVGATASQVSTNRGFLVDPELSGVADFISEILTDIQVKHTFPEDYLDNPSYAGNTYKTGGEATVYVPERTITVTRQVVTSGDAISQLAKNYVGKVNSIVWEFQPSDLSETWLCTGITGVSNDNGVSYTVTYNFTYREDKWYQTIVYIDPNTGRPPIDLVDGEGKKLYALQSNIDFNPLGLV